MIYCCLLSNSCNFFWVVIMLALFMMIRHCQPVDKKMQNVNEDDATICHFLTHAHGLYNEVCACNRKHFQNIKI